MTVENYPLHEARAELVRARLTEIGRPDLAASVRGGAFQIDFLRSAPATEDELTLVAATMEEVAGLAASYSMALQIAFAS